MPASCNTLGADMHGYNTFVPPPPGTPGDHPDDENHPFAGQARFCLTQAMSSMLALGLTLQQVVPMVTSNAVAMAGLSDEIGALKPGMAADVSVLDDAGPFQAAGQREDRSHRRTSAGACVLPACGPPL
jgi:dihydroorotase